VGGDITAYSHHRKFTTLSAAIVSKSPTVGWATGFRYEIRWTSTNLSGSVNIKLSTDGGISFSSIETNIPNTGSAMWSIPDGQNILSNKCKLKIESYLNNTIYGISNTFSISSGTLPANVTLSASIPFNPNPYLSTEYKLFSCPGIVDTKKFGDFFAGTEKTDWRAFTDNGSSSNYLMELNTNSSLTTGIGYWVIKKGNFDLPNVTITMPKLDTLGATFNIPLHTGWNIIGNPFDKTIPWQAVLAWNNLPPFTLLRGYSNFYTAETQLEPFKGYYFFNETDLSALKLPYPFTIVSSAQPVPKINWKIQLSLESDINTDPENYIGISPISKYTKDQLDTHKPPLFMDQGFLFFSHPEWNERFDRFSSDFRPILGDGQVWDFEVSNPRMSRCTLHFNGIEGIPSENDVVLINMLNSTPIHLRKNLHYSFEMLTNNMKFKLLVGSKDFVDKEIAGMIPKSFELEQNFPNPFNSSTSISFKLPEEVQICLEVYNELGQKMKTLATGNYKPGIHTIIWDGTDNSGGNVASGIYFYRLMTGSKLVESQKMILLK